MLEPVVSVFVGLANWGQSLWLKVWAAEALKIEGNAFVGRLLRSSLLQNALHYMLGYCFSYVCYWLHLL